MALEPKAAKVSLKRTIYEKSTGKPITVYHIDAREFLARGDYVPSLKQCSKKIQKEVVDSKTEEEIAAEEAAKAEEKRLAEEALANSAGNVNLATWGDWSNEELVAKGREAGVRDPSNKSREKLIEALAIREVLPSDDKASTEE